MTETRFLKGFQMCGLGIELVTYYSADFLRPPKYFPKKNKEHN